MASQTDLEPRAYQKEALGWALEQKRAVCCLPTGTGKTFVGLLWVQHLLEKGMIRRALILEPTRLLVNQTAGYYGEHSKIECPAIDGRQPPEERRELWASDVVIATPHTAYNDLHLLTGPLAFDAVLIDECHHTIGQHPFARLMDEVTFAYKLGLSATVPQRLEPLIREHIGWVKRWTWENEEIRKHTPRWVGELYEAELQPAEAELLRQIRQQPGRHRLAGLLERYLTRDGSAALYETTTKSTKLSTKLRQLLEGPLAECRDRLHKLDVLADVLHSHDFTKAIVFTDRKAVGRAILRRFPELNPAFLQGGKDRSTQGDALECAAADDCKLVVATQAGEEGIDLPSADLVISWGSVASEIRFIQRHGRIMRKTREDRLKFAVFIVTPETADYDSFVKGLERAQASKQIDVGETFGWDSRVLWPKTTWWNLTAAMHDRPQTFSELQGALGVRPEKVDDLLGGALTRGRLFYFYDVHRMACAFVKERIKMATLPWDSPEFAAERTPEALISLLREASPDQLEWLRRKLRSLKTSLFGDKQFRMYGLCAETAAIRQRWPEQFAVGGEAVVTEDPLRSPRWWMVPAAVTQQNAARVADQLVELASVLSVGRRARAGKAAPGAFAVRKGRGLALRFYFVPTSGAVLTLLAANGLKLFELGDRIRAAAGEEDLVRSLAPWLEPAKACALIA